MGIQGQPKGGGYVLPSAMVIVDSVILTVSVIKTTLVLTVVVMWRYLVFISNRIKKSGDSGIVKNWWERSAISYKSYDSYGFCVVSSSGFATGNYDARNTLVVATYINKL